MTLSATFLGTSGAVPTVERNTSALHLRREGDAFLFDAGEGTQRQMMRYGTGFDVDAVFLSHVHGDHVLGLPGLVQTLDFNDRETALDIYTPRGTGDEVRDLVTATGATTSFRLDVHEVSAGETVLERDEYGVEAFHTEHRTRSVGYALVENDRKGRFDREHAEELGVPVGPQFGKLHAGNSVELDDGTVVKPEQVVGNPRPGRTVVYTGDTRPIDATVAAAEDADLLVHDATFSDQDAERARQTAHSTGGEAGRIARRAGVDRLALTHISSRYGGAVGALKADAADEHDGETLLAHDGLTIDIPYQ
ncbi:ribonuclease Z [Halarchaeum salinum]|uniref:Ribonuclease Z n=1 Tax=Halarchaeum salinum TaxID=489912 RepID=A0AAV3S512_9EURY